jgi:hypothetical protein
VVEENSNSEVGNFLGKLDALCLQAGAATWGSPTTRGTAGSGAEGPSSLRRGFDRSRAASGVLDDAQGSTAAVEGGSAGCCWEPGVVVVCFFSVAAGTSAASSKAPHLQVWAADSAASAGRPR